MVVLMRRPTSDTASIAGAAIMGLRSIYKPGFQYAKAGVMLLDLQDSSVEQIELDLEDPETGRDRSGLMHALDAVNDRWGRGTLKIGSAKFGTSPRDWTMKQERRTPAYTKEWEDMPTARA